MWYLEPCIIGYIITVIAHCGLLLLFFFFLLEAGREISFQHGCTRKTRDTKQQASHTHPSRDVMGAVSVDKSKRGEVHIVKQS